MGVKVIDASAVAALLFGEPEAELSPDVWRVRVWSRPRC
jgi:uncharacterized protein with PIN domain